MGHEINPWVSMWTHPRTTIRFILQTHPKKSLLSLASIYSLQNFFYLANYWSLGIFFPFYAILLTGIVLSPLIGWVWLYFSAWILHFTGKWLGGKAPRMQLRAAVAWSKLPMSIALLMWVILLMGFPEYTFILDAGGPSSVFILLISLILSTWSWVLLVQTVREVQHFSIVRSIVNIFFEWLISSFVFLFVFLIFRYVYILTI